VGERVNESHGSGGFGAQRNRQEMVDVPALDRRATQDAQRGKNRHSSECHAQHGDGEAEQHTGLGLKTRKRVQYKNSNAD